MDKPIPYKVVTIIFAILILFSASSFTVDMHFCQKKLQNISFIGKAESCHSTEPTPNQTCVHHQGTCDKSLAFKKQKKDCCSNKSLVLGNENSLTVEPQINSFQEVDFKFGALFSSGFLYLDYKVVKNEDFQTYRPPPLFYPDKQVLFQTFLI